MAEVPVPNSGTVSLNLMPTAEPKVQNFAVMDHDHAEPALNLNQDINFGTKLTDMADLAISNSGALLQGKSLKTWVIVLVAAASFMLVVFFVLARQTSLFQGNLTNVVDRNQDQAIINPSFDNSAAPRTTETNPELDQLINSIATGTTGNTSTTGNNQPSTPQQATQNQPSTTNGPIIDEGIFVNTVTTRPEATISPSGGQSTNILPSTPIVDPILNPGSVVGGGFVPGTNLQANNTTTTNPLPSLTSNTNSNVLANNHVSGNTGPGLLVYLFLPIFYFLKRQYVK
jgi:hypothetical protein